jgi:hypothetical protein
MTLVQQQAQEVLGVLLLIIRIVCHQEVLEDKFGIYHGIRVWLIELILGVKVLLNAY